MNQIVFLWARRAASPVASGPSVLLALIAWSLLPRPALAQSEPTPQTQDQTPPKQTTVNQPLLPYELGLQATLIDQNLFKFHSPYEGPHSFLSRNENEKSDTYTLYMGVRLTQGFEAYLDPEMARGNGLSRTIGLAGFTNGDVIRNPDVGQQPYLARYIVRYTVSTGHGQEKIEAGENQIAGTEPVHRVVVTLGKFAVTDVFDTNSYANSTRTQFMNWALINNAAYDYAADTRGYTQGVAAQWINPNWTLRIGTFQMPTEANGPSLSGDWIHSRGDQMELELHPHLAPKGQPFVMRLLAYRNVGRMGNYDAALALARENGTTPNIIDTRQRGHVKYGFGLNFEQPLGDDGNTGLFGRYGWDDGATESFCYTECDRTACLGGQLSGARWHRPSDHWAIAVVQNDLSGSHKSYLAAGGLGFILGDGALTYGPERIMETYYNYQVAKPLMLSLDYQFIANLGYNEARGPVSVVSARVHLEY